MGRETWPWECKGLCTGGRRKPTVALSYFCRVYSGATPDLDIGSARDSALFLASADLKGFHYDTNYLFNEVDRRMVHRAQFGQTLSVSHSLVKKLGISGELWHFTQPFLRSNAVGNLWALNYNVRKNLVLDGGFNRGLTGRPRDGNYLSDSLTCFRIKPAGAELVLSRRPQKKPRGGRILLTSFALLDCPDEVCILGSIPAVCRRNPRQRTAHKPIEQLWQRPPPRWQPRIRNLPS